MPKRCDLKNRVDVRITVLGLAPLLCASLRIEEMTSEYHLGLHWVSKKLGCFFPTPTLVCDDVIQNGGRRYLATSHPGIKQSITGECKGIFWHEIAHFVRNFMPSMTIYNKSIVHTRWRHCRPRKVHFEPKMRKMFWNVEVNDSTLYTHAYMWYTAGKRLPRTTQNRLKCVDISFVPKVMNLFVFLCRVVIRDMR